MPAGAPAGRRGLATSTLTVLAALAASGIAVWLIPASVHIVDWPRGDAQRIAVFAPLYRLTAIAVATLVAAVAVLLLGRHRREPLASVLAPLNILWVWTVPYWPWLPDRWPLLVALAGPIRWAFAALALGGTIARVWPAIPVGRLRPGRRTVFALSFLIYLGFGLYTLRTNGLGGDEPHYLVITQSLMRDGDLKIENNHQRRDYQSYFPGELRPDYMTRGIDLQIYSIHAPGLSALLIPGFAIGGAPGAVATMALLAALAALAIFDIACLVSSVSAAWVTWAAVCLTVPFIPHAWSLFPEMAGTSIVAWGLLWGMRPGERSAAVWGWRGLCLAWLPWLHTKFSVLLAGIAVYLLWTLRRQWGRAAALVAPIAVSGLAWFASFYLIYGTLSPEAPYGEYAARFVRFENVPRSVLGLLFDQKFGLLVHAPAYAMAVPGFWILVRDRSWRVAAFASLVIACLFGVSSARLFMWWGGSSAPARFLVPVTPLLAVGVAAGVHQLRSIAWRATWSACLAFGVVVAAAGAFGADRYLLYSEPHGVSRMLELLQGSAPLTEALPTFTQPEWRAPALQMLPWAAAVAVALAFGWVVARRTRSALWIVTGQVCAFITASAAFASSLPATVRADASTRGDLALIERFDPVNTRAFDYGRMTRLSPEAWLGTLGLTVQREPGGEPDPLGRITSALRLPPGLYEARVWFDGGRQRPGALQADAGYDNVLARVDGPLGNPSTLTLSLPVPVPSLWLEVTDLASARAVRRLDVTVRSLTPASARETPAIQAIEAVPGRMTAYVAHLAGTYPEHGVFWTRGLETARLLLVPAGASTVEFITHVGPGAGRAAVQVRVGDRAESLELEGNGTASLKVPLPPGAAVVPIEIRSGSAFRPAEVEPSSNDTRQLGCQVRLVLE